MGRVFVSMCLLLPVCAFAPPEPATAVFQQFVEYPHPFLPARWQRLTHAQLTQLKGQDALDLRALQQENRRLVTAALQQVFRRLTLPILPEGAAEAQRVFVFEYLHEKLRPLDPMLAIYPSGGVVRSALAYLLRQYREAQERAPSLTVAEFFTRFVLDSTTGPREPIPALEVRGVGSDFDCWLRGNPELFDTIRTQAITILESAETGFGFRRVEGGLKKSIFAAPDVKEYAKQLAWAVAEGGSTLDFLSFDVEGGRFLEPAEHPTIVDDFVLGFFSYVEPRDAKLLPDPLKQLVRGFRAFLELPSLRLRDDARFRSELAEWHGALTKEGSDVAVSRKVVEQFAKMVRNSTDSGARNRFFRVAEETLDAEIVRLIRALEAKVGRRLFPEYLDRFGLDDARAHKLPLDVRAQLAASGGLVSVADFVAKHTHAGVLFHGTPEIEYALAILRQGLFLSGGGQGVAVFGRGTYTSPQRDVAQGYSRDGGLVFELPVRKDASFVVLDWLKAQHHPFIASIADQARKAGQDPFAVLAREYGVDVILHEHVLLQNSAVIDFSDAFGLLAAAYRSLIYQDTAPDASRIRAWDQYQQLRRLALAMQTGEVAAPPPREWLIAELSDANRARVRLERRWEQRHAAVTRAWTRFQEATTDEKRTEIWTEVGWEYLLTPTFYRADGTTLAHPHSEPDLATVAVILEGIANGTITLEPGGVEDERWRTLAYDLVGVLENDGLSATERATFEALLTPQLQKGVALRGEHLFTDDLKNSYTLSYILNHIPQSTWNQSDLLGILLPMVRAETANVEITRIWFFQTFLRHGDWETLFRDQPDLRTIADQMPRRLLVDVFSGHGNFDIGFQHHDKLRRLLTNRYYAAQGIDTVEKFLRAEIDSSDAQRFFAADRFLFGASKELRKEKDLISEAFWAHWFARRATAQRLYLAPTVSPDAQLLALGMLGNRPNPAEDEHRGARVARVKDYREELLVLVEQGTEQVQLRAALALRAHLEEAAQDGGAGYKKWMAAIRTSNDPFVVRARTALDALFEQVLREATLDEERLSLRRTSEMTHHGLVGLALQFLSDEDDVRARPRARAFLEAALTLWRTRPTLSVAARRQLGREIQEAMWALGEKRENEDRLSPDEVLLVAELLGFPSAGLRSSVLEMLHRTSVWPEATLPFVLAFLENPDGDLAEELATLNRHQASELRDYSQSRDYLIPSLPRHLPAAIPHLRKYLGNSSLIAKWTKWLERKDSDEELLAFLALAPGPSETVTRQVLRALLAVVNENNPHRVYQKLHVDGHVKALQRHLSVDAASERQLRELFLALENPDVARRFDWRKAPDSTRIFFPQEPNGYSVSRRVSWQEERSAGAMLQLEIIKLLQRFPRPSLRTQRALAASVRVRLVPSSAYRSEALEVANDPQRERTVLRFFAAHPSDDPVVARSLAMAAEDPDTSVATHAAELGVPLPASCGEAIETLRTHNFGNTR